jgi:hypothetical protein
MDRQSDVLRVQAGLEREHRLGDQVTGPDADDAGADEPVALWLEQKLREALRPAEAQGAAGLYLPNTQIPSVFEEFLG